MNKGMLLYFSEEEFALMMDLAGGQEYSLFLSNPIPDTRRLTEAFIRLFQRGLLTRTHDTFELSEKGAFFHEIRESTHIVLLKNLVQEEKTILCYVHGKHLWLAELFGGNPAERYRIGLYHPRDLAGRLLESGFLPNPKLLEEDTTELKLLFEDDLEQAPDGNEIVQIEKYSHTGKLLRKYLLYRANVGVLMQTTSAKHSQTQIYTKEALREILHQCFGG